MFQVSLFYEEINSISEQATAVHLVGFVGFHVHAERLICPSCAAWHTYKRLMQI